MYRFLKSPMAAFLAKLTAIAGMWFLLYDMWLLPDGRIDEVISLNVASVSASIMEFIGYEPWAGGREIILPETRGVYIADGCNGLAAIGLFIGFVLAYPGRWENRLWFIPLGIAIVYLTNVLRVVGLTLAQLYWPAGFDMLHGFGMTTIFYVVVFLLWAAWTHMGQKLPLKMA